MKKNLICLLLISFLLPVALFAGNYGSIKGKVVDSEGKSVVGASVRIEGTRLGGFVKADGKYAVSNISPGSYKVRFTSVGYQTTEVTVKISSDEVTDVNITMKPEGKTTDEITVYGNNLVSNIDIGMKREFDNKMLTSIGREGIQSIVGLSAGVFNSGGGFIIRGSRENESQIRVDGFDVGNQFTGGFGMVGSSYYPMISSFATEEVQVLTGGFSAEYGNALGGIVNSTARTGRTDRYEGYFRWRTDVPALWGSQASGLKLVREGDRYKAIDYGPGAKLQGGSETKLEFGAGGPIPLLGKSTFFISASNFYEKYRSNSYEIYDPWHFDGQGNWVRNNLGLLPGNQSWVKNITGRMKLAVTSVVDLTVGGSFGMTNIESSGQGWIYADDPGSVEGLPSYGVPEYKAKQAVVNQLVTNIMAKVSHRLSSSSYYEFNVSNTSNNDDQSKRMNFNDPSYFSGYDVWMPQDKWRAVNSQLIPESDKVLDQYELLTQIKRSKDLYYYGDIPLVNPLTGYIEGAGSATTGRNAYGLVGYFTGHGNDRSFSFRRGNYWQIDGNYNLLTEDKEFGHSFKTGFELRFYNMQRHMNSLPWDENAFKDVYTNQWGGNIYEFDNPTLFNKTSKGFTPMSMAAYVQDQITYKGIIFTPGLRFDLFSPNSTFRTILNPFQPVQADTAMSNSTAKYQISPRINVTYPITDRSNVSISYGLLFMMPQLQYLFDGFSTARLRGNATLGDPNIKAQRVNQYQVTYSNQVTDEFALDVAAYYKDIYNQLGISYIPAVPDAYFIYTVADYGNTKGLEITFRKMATDHFGFNINYNLSQSVATAQSPDANYNLPTDPYTDKYAVPLAEIPTSSDRRHRVNVILNFIWGKEDGPSIAGFKPLENVNINLTGFFQTGLPYTRLDKSGKAVGEENAERQPSIWNTNFRLSKGFWLKDWFGDGAGNSMLELFVDIDNIFNLRTVAGVFSRTGDPIDDGVNFYMPITNFSPTVYYKEANYGKAESFSQEQYSQFGERLYSPNGDLDHNGSITQIEKYHSFTNYLENIRAFKGNFQAPITVYFGMMLRF